MPALRSLVPAFALPLLIAPIATQQPQPIADLNLTPAPVTYSSHPRAFGRLGGDVLLQATTPALGAELWAMDIATRNVRMVADIVPGSGGSQPTGGAELAGAFWFAATDASGQRELWRSDGTTAGTSRLLDIGGTTSASPTEIHAINGFLVFVANGGPTVGAELFVSDGTAAGTLVVDIDPGASASSPSGLFEFGGYVYFAATRPAEGRALWRTDGTVAGTQLVMDPAPGSAVDGPTSLGVFNNQLLFAGGGAVWLSNGTAAGTVAIETAPVESLAATATRICYLAGGIVYGSNGTPGTAQPILTLPIFSLLLAPIQAFGTHFLLNTYRLNGVYTAFLSDGTAAGTFAAPTYTGNEFAVVGNRICFASGTQALWSSDGTVAGTTPIGNVTNPQGLFTIPGTSTFLFGGFSASSPLIGRELWISNGTTAGTQMVANIAVEPPATLGSFPTNFVDAAGSLFFVTTAGTPALWRTDGTAAGTVAMSGVVAPNSNTAQPTAVGSRVYYANEDAAHGVELWVTDGTPAGTHLVHDAWPGASSGNPTQLVAAGDWLYYLADSGITRGLWRTDGTAAGTVALSGQGAVNSAVALGRGLVFTFQGFGYGIPLRLYHTDGTPTGTTYLTDLSSNAGSALTEPLQRVGDRVYATAYDHNRLFVTDGTFAGTSEVTAGMANPPQSLDRLIAFHGQLVFQATRPGSSIRFWITDGTAAGTHEWFAPPGGGNLTGADHTVMGDLILWNGSNGNGLQVWRTDGTTAGTFPLSIGTGAWFASIADHQAWFATSSSNGVELWRTDGTVAGTAQFADLLPGNSSSYPSGMTLSAGKLYFAAEHPLIGTEPWVLDVGTNFQPIGYACSAHGKAGPSLRGSDPVLGTTMTLSIQDGPNPGLSLALLDNQGTAITPLGVGYCASFISLSSYGWSVGALTNGQVQHTLAIPNNPALVGLLFRTQALVLGAGGIPELEMTNAIAFEIGQ